jgi:NAD(P)-dependent dehydrogenase (short-subunit alcohol dehydrogenase family)
MTKRAAFVVGATGGLGRAACLALARDWDGVAIGYRSSAQKAQAIADELGDASEGLPVHCDLADAHSVTAAIQQAHDHFGSIGTMVFASGVAIAQPYVSKIGESEWREVIETELIGLTRVVSTALPLFRKQGGGSFVIVVSVANYAYPPGDALSSVPKAAMEALGRAVAKEEGRFNIRANMVAPGIIAAGLGADFLENLYTPEIWDTQRKRIALQRFGTGEDIGETIAFLASERARYITGQTIIVDGGFSL